MPKCKKPGCKKAVHKPPSLPLRSTTEITPTAKVARTFVVPGTVALGMSRHKDVNWSAVVRNALEDALRSLGEKV